jgi:hypothetical protein
MVTGRDLGDEYKRLFYGTGLAITPYELQGFLKDIQGQARIPPPSQLKI